MHTRESVDVDPQANSKRSFPTLEEQRRWLHYRVNTREFESSPVFSDRPVYEGDDVAIDAIRVPQPGNLILCKTKDEPTVHRLVFWPTDKAMSDVVLEGESVVGPAVSIGHHFVDIPPYLHYDKRDFVLASLREVPLIRDTEDEWKLETIMDLIPEVQEFETEVHTLLENLNVKETREFDPVWYVHLFAARILHGAMEKRVLV